MLRVGCNSSDDFNVRRGEAVGKLRPTASLPKDQVGFLGLSQLGLFDQQRYNELSLWLWADRRTIS